VCGICGLVDNKPNPLITESVLQVMTDSLRHRGPDGSGLHLEPGVGLGHRRLSIIDLAGGQQPMYNDDESIVIVFNGEIYNYKEVRADLIKRGHVFRSESDTEVIIRLYEEKGRRCLDDLNGMFSFAIWDSRKRRLFAARDRLGEKPFYYHENACFIAFASEIKSILKVPGLRGEIDTRALDDYLSYGYVPAPKTIYGNVKKLLPAHYLLWENGKTTTECYWRSERRQDAPGRPVQEYRQELQELLTSSINMQLRSDVPIGAFLSGGIDSSLIVAIASQQHSEQLNTFSVGFQEVDFDESSFARAVADRYQTNHHEIHLEPLNLSEFPKLVAHFDEPFADASALPTYVVCREAAKHVKVCLSGDAGDELFGGYPQYRYEKLESSIDRVPPALRHLIFGTVANAWPLRMSGKGWLSRMSTDGEHRYQRNIGIFDSSERGALFRDEFQNVIDRRAWLLRPYFDSIEQDEMSKRMAADLETYLPDDILVKVDRDAMFNSLEVRVPLLDYRIVEFAGRLPLDMRIRDGNQKFLLKELLRELVPAFVVNRGKQGFGMPLRHWFRNEYRGFLEEMLLSPDSKCHEYFRPGQIRKLFDAHQLGPRDLSDRLWALLWLEQWLRQVNT